MSGCLRDFDYHKCDVHVTSHVDVNVMRLVQIIQIFIRQCEVGLFSVASSQPLFCDVAVMPYVHHNPVCAVGETTA